MLKATIVNSVVVFTSGNTIEELQKLKNFKPEALKLKDEKGNVKFAISTGSTPSINGNGICFNEMTDSGKASLTIALAPDFETAEDKEAFIKETFGYAILTANSMDAQIAEALTQVGTDFAAMSDSISTVEL